MITYAIRDVRDGFYMPAHQPSKMSGSYSWDEPKVDGGRWGPRLFKSKRSAQQALVAWLQGRWGRHYVSSTDEWAVEEWIVGITRQNNRHRKNMEIVKFSLREISRKV